ncbi:MAG TPA: transposase [Allocoleopsis sp.]
MLRTHYYTKEKPQETEHGLKTIKVKVYPTPLQKSILRQWFSTTRYIYNKTLHHINETNCKKNFRELRNKFVTKESTIKKCLGCDKETKSNRKNFICCNDSKVQDMKFVNPEINEWELKTPKQIRESSVSDLIKAFKTCFSNLKNKNINKFKMKFRKKRDTQSICINKESISYFNGYFKVFPTFLGNLKTGRRSKKDYVISHETRMTFNGLHYFLHILVPTETKRKIENNDTIALDPGLRTFITGYSPKEVVEFKRNPDLLKKLRNKIAKLNSLRSKKQLRNKKKIKKLFLRLSNVIDSLHWKTINYLTSNYSKILLPHFESQKMTRKGNKETNKLFSNLKHHQFKLRLLHSVRMVENCKVILVTEEFTSKTCGSCGNLNETLGSKKIFECKTCGFKVDRDINGARNIFIKYMRLCS